MNRYHKEKGAGFIGVFMTLLVIIGGSLLAIKLVPVYIDNYKITKTLSALKAQTQGQRITVMNVRQYLLKASEINDWDTFLPDDALVVRNRGNGVEVMVDYEERIPLFANLSLAASFTNHWQERP